MFILPWVWDICGNITMTIHLQSKKQKVEAALIALSEPGSCEPAMSPGRQQWAQGGSNESESQQWAKYSVSHHWAREPTRSQGTNEEPREPAMSQGGSNELESQQRTKHPMSQHWAREPIRSREPTRSQQGAWEPTMNQGTLVQGTQRASYEPGSQHWVREPSNEPGTPWASNEPGRQ